ncbi:Nucleolar protein 16 [Arachnomyces sp. PD_36]|nr:Nucleolar protein 16 [Arachnomyces sp. PD_36]
MGRELQKRKNRSSVSRVKHKSKLAKNGHKKINVLGNAIIADNWDKKLTLLQNYHRLGLTSNLNEPTGGTEKRFNSNNSDPLNSSAFSKPTDPLHISTSTKPALQITPKEARVERDPETGKILRVIHDSADETTIIAGRPRRKDNPLNDPLDDLLDVPAEVPALAESGPHPTPGVVRALEQQASREEEALKKRKPRAQSKREEEWVGKLVERYGDDVKAMVRDRRLNPMQQSEGDIQRRIKKWKARRG